MAKIRRMRNRRQTAYTPGDLVCAWRKGKGKKQRPGMTGRWYGPGEVLGAALPYKKENEFPQRRSTSSCMASYGAAVLPSYVLSASTQERWWTPGRKEIPPKTQMSIPLFHHSHNEDLSHRHNQNHNTLKATNSLHHFNHQQLFDHLTELRTNHLIYLNQLPMIHHQK